MDEIVKIYQTVDSDENPVNCINAKDLHEFLENGYTFSKWMNSRIEKYEFIEHQDYVKIYTDINDPTARIDYWITVDMAKELSMIERNEKGKIARKYFIECEKRLKSIETTKEPNYADYLPKTFHEALIDYADTVQDLQEVSTLLEHALTKANQYDQLMSTESGFDVGAVCQVLGVKPSLRAKPFGRIKMFNYMRQKGWIQQSSNKPYQTEVNNEHFIVRFSNYGNSPKPHTLLTTKGLKRLVKELKNDNFIFTGVVTQLETSKQIFEQINESENRLKQQGEYL